MLHATKFEVEWKEGNGNTAHGTILKDEKDGTEISVISKNIFSQTELVRQAPAMLHKLYTLETMAKAMSSGHGNHIQWNKVAQGIARLLDPIRASIEEDKESALEGVANPGLAD